jgi:dTDP-4-amino-4,6-dideoxygalactose transaminase
MILLNDFKREPEELIVKELAAVERVIRSGWYVLGSEVDSFEKRWSEYCGTNHTVSVANGMDAIEIGLRSLNIGVGDEVITTPMTAFATVLAIIHAGATPVLADIDPTTGLLDLDSVERCISDQTKAVLLVHLYGQIKHMDLWTKFCQEKNIYLLEDCAQSHGATWNGKKAGSFGEWGAYSFYPTKNLGAIGDAGALVTNSPAITKKSQMLRNYGQSERYHHPEIGLNSRLDELQAAILSVRIEWLNDFTARRQAIAQSYFDGITNPQVKMLTPSDKQESHVHHLFVVMCEDRDKLSAHLKESGVGNLIHYPVPIHHQLPCQQLRKDPAGLNQAEYHSNHCLSIPCHPQMSDTDIHQVIEAINGYH